LRATIGALLVAVVVAFGAVQFASDALNARAAAPGTIPTRIPASFGAAVYRWLERIAPAPYVEATLARHDLESADPDAAERHAVRLPASPMRDELFARIASARGQPTLAFEYFLAAPNADAVQESVERLAHTDPAAAFALERLLAERLALLRTHPDAVGEAYWRMGLLANRQAWRQIPGSTTQRAWLRRAFGYFEAAVELAPLSERYVLADANQADLVGERRRAAELFGQAVEIDPASADALGGLGVVAFESGDRRAAIAYLARARRLDPQARMVRALERRLR
jgi:tetratricopeptide (TPR) repeat protein